MKKLVVMLIALACISGLGISAANAGGSGLYIDNTVTPMVLPINGETDQFKVTFLGVLSTSVFDGYPTIECGDCSFTIVAKKAGSELADKTMSFGVDADGFFVGNYGPLSSTDVTSDMTFKVRYSGPFLGDSNAIHDSEEFSVCDIAGASSHFSACKMGIVFFQPIPMQIFDGCPNDPDKLIPGLCGCGEVDVDDNNNGICDLDEPDPSDPTSDVDNDGWTDEIELLCGSDPSDSSIVPDDNDQDGICNDQDTDNDNDGWTDDQEDDCVTDPLDANDTPLDDDGDGICNLLDDDDLEFSTGSGNSASSADADALEFGGGNCSLNPDATADFSILFLLILLCLTTPVAVALHIRKRL